MLGTRIALLRIARGWSQAELARRIGVSASAVGMYEQGRREPSLQLVVSIAREFSVTTDYLLTGDMKEGLSEFLQSLDLSTLGADILVKMLRQATRGSQSVRMQSNSVAWKT